MSFLRPRVVAAMLLVVLTGVPVAGLLCGRECIAAPDATTGADEASEHCHEPSAESGPAIAAVSPASCALVTIQDVATPARPSATHDVGPTLEAQQPVARAHRPHRMGVFVAHSRSPGATRHASAPLPLRI